MLCALLSLMCPDETISGYADREVEYVLVEMGDRPAPRATIQFPEEGVVTGQGPCNRYNATQTIAYPWIEIGPIASTRRACADLDGESAFFDMLTQATLIEVQGDVLILSGGADDVLAVFEAP